MFAYIKKKENHTKIYDAVKPWVTMCRTQLQNKNQLWIIGEYGCGKTTIAKEILDHKYVAVGYEELKSIKAVELFLSKVHNSALLIDNPELDWQGTSHFWERVRGKNTLVACSRTQPSLPWIDVIRVNGRNLNEQFTVGGSRDEFFKPKRLLEAMFCTWGKKSAVDHIGEPLEEHGYSWSMVHENYPQVTTFDEIVRISECMSMADCMDQHVYDGNWDLMPYFSINAIIEPAMIIDHRLQGMKAGSSWTKHNHACMKANKAFELRLKGLPLDALQPFVEICKKHPEYLNEYKLDKKNIDTLRHLTWGRQTLKLTKEWKKRVS